MSTHPYAAEEVVTNQGEGEPGDGARNRDESDRGSRTEENAATLEDRQKAYLLHQLFEVPGNTLGKGVANRKIGAPAKRDLHLDAAKANQLRDALAKAGHLRVVKENRVEKISLTDDGREYLQTLPQDLFRLTRTEPEVPTELLGYQQAYLLLLLANAKKQKLTCGALVKKLMTGQAKTKLGFEEIISRQVIVPLIDEECIRETGRRQRGDGLYPVPHASYHLTGKGEQRLIGMKQYPRTEITIPAEVWNKLVEFRPQAAAALPAAESYAPPAPDHATEQPRQEERAAQTDQVPPDRTPSTPVPAQLGDAILARFHELAREKYAHVGMVPIHELRAWVARQFGQEAASHQTFDAAVHELRKRQQVRFVTITDLRDGKPDQMEASIPGVNETFFYLESAHEQSFNF